MAVLIRDHDNAMLSSIKRLINNIGLILIEIRKIKDEAVGKERTFAYSIVDTYDHFDSKTNVIESAFGGKAFDKAEMRNERGN